MITLLILVVLGVVGKFVYDTYITNNTEKNWQKYRETNPLDAAKIDLEEQKLNLLQADAYYNESKKCFATDRKKSKSLLEKALALSPNNKDYLFLYNEVNRVIQLNSASNTGLLSYHFQELIQFIENDFRATLLDSNENSFAMATESKKDYNPLIGSEATEYVLFLVEKKPDEYILSVTEVRDYSNGKSLKDSLLKRSIRPGITAEEVKLIMSE